MIRTDLDSPVGNWVAAHPHTAKIFEALQIEYCCGGGKSLKEACCDRGLDPSSVVKQLEQAIVNENPSSTDWLNSSLTDLCDHIEQTHHAYLKQELPQLSTMIAKVAKTHQAIHPELANLEDVLAALRNELEPHMFKEEHVLFPAIRRLEGSTEAPQFPFGTVANPIRMMEQEHDNAGYALSRIHALTGGYQVPDDACNTYRAMLAALRFLERDLHEHVHKENNILFPRAIEVERALSSGLTASERGVLSEDCQTQQPGGTMEP